MTCIKRIITILAAAITPATALASRPLEVPQNPGVHGAYVYKATDTINGTLHEEAEVIRRENIKPVETADTLIRNVLRDDIQPSLGKIQIRSATAKSLTPPRGKAARRGGRAGPR